MRLHPQLGVNPRLTFCPRCGGDAPELILLGARDHKITCSCGAVNYGASSTDKCGKCRMPLGYDSKREKIGEHEKLPGSLCKACEQEAQQFKAIVEEGGIYWKCECGAEGVALKDSNLAVAVRKHSNILPPNPVGLEVHNCPKCAPEPEAKETQ